MQDGRVSVNGRRLDAMGCFAGRSGFPRNTLDSRSWSSRCWLSLANRSRCGIGCHHATTGGLIQIHPVSPDRAGSSSHGCGSRLAHGACPLLRRSREKFRNQQDCQNDQDGSANQAFFQSAIHVREESLGAG